MAHAKYSANRKPTQGVRPGAMQRARGVTQPAAAPTGRLVEVITKGVPSMVAHWLPDAEKSGVYAWKCPLESCGAWFTWSVDKKQWIPASDDQ